MRFQLVFFLSITFATTLYGCKENDAPPAIPESSVEENIQTIDSLFSDMSSKEGMKAAFLHYMEEEAVIVRPNSNPMVGADAVAFLSDLSDSDFRMTWKADRTLLASSNDLGYAYGSYSISTPQIDSTLRGTYVHIWKKLEDGTWKFVFNSWNEAALE